MYYGYTTVKMNKSLASLQKGAYEILVREAIKMEPFEQYFPVGLSIIILLCWKVVFN